MRVFSEADIKDILQNWQKMVQSIRQKMRSLYQELEDTDDMLRSAALPSSQIQFTPGQKGIHRDLGDVLEHYSQQLYERSKEVRKLMWMLSEDEESILRVWHCFHALEEPYYSILYHLYVENQLYHKVERDCGWSHRKFEEKRKEGIRLLLKYYESNISVSDLLYQQKKEEKAYAGEGRKYG